MISGDHELVVGGDRARSARAATHATETVSPCAFSRASRRCDARGIPVLLVDHEPAAAGASVDIREIDVGEAVEVLGGRRRGPRQQPVVGPAPARAPSASIRSTISNEPRRSKTLLRSTCSSVKPFSRMNTRLAIVGGDRAEARRRREASVRRRRGGAASRSGSSGGRGRRASRFDDRQQRLLGALAPVLGVDHEVELDGVTPSSFGDHELHRAEDLAVALGDEADLRPVGLVLPEAARPPRRSRSR